MTQRVHGSDYDPEMEKLCPPYRIRWPDHPRSQLTNNGNDLGKRKKGGYVPTCRVWFCALLTNRADSVISLRT